MKISTPTLVEIAAGGLCAIIAVEASLSAWWLLIALICYVAGGIRVGMKAWALKQDK